MVAGVAGDVCRNNTGQRGSKRLPGKNKRMFHGKPLVAWTIEAAILSKCFDIVLLSTDSQEIAEIGIEYGAEVPFLRNCAHDDHAPSSEATLAALSQAEDYWKDSFDVVAQLMANCPLRTSQHICDAMNSFSLGNASSQISCFKFGWMNPWWAAKMDSMVVQNGFSLRPFLRGLRICPSVLPKWRFVDCEIYSLGLIKLFTPLARF